MCNSRTTRCFVLHTHLQQDPLSYTAIFTYRFPLLLENYPGLHTRTHTHTFPSQSTATQFPLSGIVRWCCSDSHSPLGPDQRVPSLLLVHLLPRLCADRTTWCCWLPVARFGIIQHNNGPRDCLEQVCPWAAR